MTPPPAIPQVVENDGGMTFDDSGASDERPSEKRQKVEKTDYHRKALWLLMFMSEGSAGKMAREEMNELSEEDFKATFGVAVPNGNKSRWDAVMDAIHD